MQQVKARAVPLIAPMGSVTCHRMLAKAGDFCHSGRKIRVTPHRVFGSGFPGSDAARRNSPQVHKGFIALHILGAPLDMFRQLAGNPWLS